MLDVNETKVNESIDVFSEKSYTDIGLQSIDDIKSSSLRMIYLENENSKLRKENLNLKLDLNKNIEIYENKLVRFKEFSSNNHIYQQEIYDLQKRLEISTKQNNEQKVQYSNEIQKIKSNFENQIMEYREKIELLQKKCAKHKQLIQTREYEKSNLEEEHQAQSKKIETLLKLFSNYFSIFFTNIDSLISFMSNGQSKKAELEDKLKIEKKKKKFFEKKCATFAEENKRFSEQIGNLTNRNKVLNEEIESFKTKQEIELNKIKMNQIIANFDVAEIDSNFQHQNQNEKMTNKKTDLILKDEESGEEIHDLHKIIAKLKNSNVHLKKRNQILKQILKKKENEMNSLQILHSNLEEKFNEIESFISNDTNSKVKINKLKRKIIDQLSTIENLRSEITKLKFEHKEELLKNEVRINNLQSNSKVYSYSNSYSFNEGNQTNSNAGNDTILNSSYCIDESVPSEIIDSLKQIIENKGLKINLKIRLITKSLSTYFNNLLLKNKSEANVDNEDNIVKSFIEKVYNLILKQFISYQSFVDNKVLRKALLERAKELVSIAEAQQNMNLNQKSQNMNSNTQKNSKIKKSSNTNLYFSKTQKNNHVASDIFASNLNESQQSAKDLNNDNKNNSFQNKKNNKSSQSSNYLNSELNTITHIDSISQLQFDSKIQQNSSNKNSTDKIKTKSEKINNLYDNENTVNNKIYVFEEEEEECFDEDKANEEEDVISEIESLVDDLKIKID